MTSRAIASLGHMRTLWEKSIWLPFIPLTYCVIMSFFGHFRWEYIVVAGGTLVLAFATPKTRDFLLDASPYVLFAITYDFVKYVIAATIRPERVITCGLRRPRSHEDRTGSANVGRELGGIVDEQLEVLGRVCIGLARERGSVGDDHRRALITKGRTRDLASREIFELPHQRAIDRTSQLWIGGQQHR